VKRTCLFLATALLAGVSASALANARDANTAAPAANPIANAALFHTVELRKTKLGKILVNSAGSILYEFTRDKPKQSACAKVSGCPEVWPAFPAQGKPSAGPGVHASLLSTIKVSGETQVTYAGHPLYIYGAAPTSTEYVGAKQFGGSWYALNAKGQPVK
jgi:predicted lipoprotein with Yx(FWY)xxD motif